MRTLKNKYIISSYHHTFFYYCLQYVFVAGDARNEVLTGVHKLGFNPELYRMNAYQGLAYDPSRKT